LKFKEKNPHLTIEHRHQAQTTKIMTRLLNSGDQLKPNY
jgi:hypothetical protein